MDLESAPLSDLTTLCRSLGWIGPNTTLVHGEPAGAGNMNRTLRVRLEQRERTEPHHLVLKQSLPFVARFPEIPAPIERGRIEAAFYQGIASEPALRQRTPQLLGFDAQHHLLCMEDLGCGSDMTTLYADRDYQPQTRLQLDTLIQWLSELHAMPTPAGFPINALMRKLNHEHIFCVPFDVAANVDTTPGLSALRQELAQDAGFRRTVEHLGDIYLGNTLFESRPVLLHGDYYPGSWLQGAQGNAAVIDPEFGFVGPSEFDLGVMHAHLTFANCPAATRTQLMQGYQRQSGFDPSLMERFAAVEVLRRLLGVAQLPLRATPAAQLKWAQDAGNLLRTHSG